LSIKVNDSKDPVAEQDSLLVQVDYANQPIPNNRLPKGLYYSFKNKWVDMITLLTPAIKKIVTANTTVPAWGSITGTLSNQTDLQSALDAKEPLIADGTTSDYWRGDKSWQVLDKTAVGLSNVDNTSDANKPISTATQTALDLKADKTGVIQLVGAYTTNTTLTGTTAETSLGYVLIPANTYGAGKTAWVDSLLLRASGTSTIVARMRISTSATPTIASATLLATNNIPNTIQYAPFVRMNIHIDSSTSTKLWGASTSVIQDNANASNISDLNIDWTVDQYIHVSAQLITSGDSIILHKLRIFL
jgi:hypothetical protein